MYSPWMPIGGCSDDVSLSAYFIWFVQHMG